MFKNYFKIAYRNLLKQKGFTFINIFGLTSGLTACFLIGLFVFDELQYDAFIPEKNNIYRIYNERAQNDINEQTSRTPPMFATTLKQDLPEVELAARFVDYSSKVLMEVGDKKFYEEGGFFAEQSFFKIFPLPLKYGSLSEALVDPSSIVISQKLAEKFFGDEDPTGREIMFDKTPYQIKGVLAGGFKFHLDINYIQPLSGYPIPEERFQSWTYQQFGTYLKLKEGADADLTESKFQSLVIQKATPHFEESNIDYTPYFQPLSEIYLYSSAFKMDPSIRGNINYVRALSIIAVFILLIACFNFVNLSTAKSLQRAKEVGVRKTIGANRRSLMYQFIGETILLTFLAVIISTILTAFILPALNNFTGKEISFSLFMNPVLLLLLAGISLVVGILAGFYPALVLSGFKPVSVLKGNFTNLLSPGKGIWLRHSLVVVQFSLSVFLIISALIVYKQVQYLHTKDLGFNKDEIMFFPMRGENMFENYDIFKDELVGVPGVSSVSIGYGFPGDIFAGDGIIVPGSGVPRHSVTQLLVDHDYLKTLNIKLLAGRDFSESIISDKDHAFIINEEAVKQLGFNTPENAIGKKLEWNLWNEINPDSLKKGEVIGVVKDFNYKSLFDKVEPTVLQIFPPAYWKVAVKINSADLAGTISGVEELWNRYSPEYPLEYKFMDENFDQMYKAEDKLRILLWIFTCVAIFVGCLGLFGLAAYVAESRKKEIGIRKIMGAVTSSIVTLLSWQFLKLVLIATIIAFPVAWLVLNSWLQDFAYRIDIPLWIFFIAGVAAMVIAFITISYQAIKAASSNPVNNLRTE